MKEDSSKTSKEKEKWKKNWHEDGAGKSPKSQRQENKNGAPHKNKKL